RFPFREHATQCGSGSRLQEFGSGTSKDDQDHGAPAFGTSGRSFRSREPSQLRIRECDAHSRRRYAGQSRLVWRAKLYSLPEWGLGIGTPASVCREGDFLIDKYETTKARSYRAGLSSAASVSTEV